MVAPLHRTRHARPSPCPLPHVFAPRDTPVRSTTRGVVARVWDHGIGGKHVRGIGPGGERHHCAHLDGFAHGIARFDRVHRGSLIGFVGGTGNARGTPPYLHYGIYGKPGAHNPWPLLQADTKTKPHTPH